MAREMSVSTIRWVMLVAFATVGLGFVVASIVGNGDPFDRLSLVTTAGFYGLLIVVAVRTLSGGETDAADGSDDDSSDGGSGSVWDLIPRWQYLGRHYEGAGATRQEQERALERIEERAEHLEDEEGRRDVESGYEKEHR